jgi:hypothetical protein
MANWLHHPTVVAARAVYERVHGAKNLKSQTKTGCDGASTKFTDPQGRIREVVVNGGEGDVSGVTEAVYDEQGTLRFVFSKTTGPGAEVTTDRVYLDETGTLVWHVVERDRGRFEQPSGRAPFPVAEMRSASGYYEETGCPTGPP